MSLDFFTKSSYLKKKKKEVIFGTSCLEAPVSKILFKLIKRKVFLAVLLYL